jgi:hypothetical protein
VATRETPSAIAVAVSDTGPGIVAEERGHVFQRFYRLERSRSTPGSGLGLSLVEAIAALHQVGIELTDNAPGLSVTLQFHAPVKTTPAEIASLSPNRNKSSRQSEAPLPSSVEAANDSALGMLSRYDQARRPGLMKGAAGLS